MQKQLNFENEKRNFGSRHMYKVLTDQKSSPNPYLEDKQYEKQFYECLRVNCLAH